ncbi:autotransporter family protein [Methylomonas albis]|uniref:Autotransporter domain-containing protein n=1 Tax=Methylomonas albis TaxID=1854563 RepID=A0ABR9D4I7_9GAMM|nr:autotransporter domain-containing protein [Methylomonas albis]MBD9357696.1 autotransporter domain-containing protein [Methylomonas albis]
MGNSATVSSGSSVSLAGSYSINEGDAINHCPNCIIQLYTAWIAPAPAGSDGFFSGIIGSGFGNQSGTFQTQLTAPKAPGSYFIGLGSTFDYSYQPNVGGGFGKDQSGLSGFAPFQVTVTPITLAYIAPSDSFSALPGYYYNTGGNFSNNGTLINNSATLSHSSGIFSNLGVISNQGVFDNAGQIVNSGSIDNVTGNTLTNAGELVNQGSFGNAGQLSNQGTFSNLAVLNNTGTISNTGQFNLAQTGLITGAGDFYNSGQGRVDISGNNTHRFDGNVSNDGVFRTVNTSVAFTGNFTNNGRYESDPSINQFNNLSIGSSGYLVGGAGDVFIVTGDFNNASTQNTLWNTANADLVFSGPSATQHAMSLVGSDQGQATAGAVNNFAWGSVSVASGNGLQLVDGNSTPGAALYASRLVLADGVSQLSSISSDYNIYIDPTLPENQYLLGAIRSFGSGSGQLAPWSLQPFTEATSTAPELTFNQQTFAPALNEACASPSGILATRCLQLQALSPEQQTTAVAALTPDQVPGQMAGPVKLGATRMDGPLTRLASLRGGGGSAPLSVNFNGIQLSANKAGAQGLGGAAGDEELFRDSPLGLFLQTRFNFANMQGDAWDRGFDSQARTVTGGADYRLSDKLVVGAAFNYTHSATQYADSAGNMSSDTYLGAIYGSYYLPQDIYLDWVGNYGGNEYAFNRQYAYSGFAGQSISATTGNQYGFALSGGKDFNWQEWAIAPYLRLEYLGMNIAQYQEQSGNGFDIITGEQVNHSFVSNLGAQISYAVSTPWGVITPAARVEWEHQYLNDNRLIHMRLAQAEPGLGNFTIQTGEPDRDYVNLGGSVSATLANGGSGFVRYETRLGQANIADHILEAGLRMSF